MIKPYSLPALVVSVVLSVTACMAPIPREQRSLPQASPKAPAPLPPMAPTPPAAQTSSIGTSSVGAGSTVFVAARYADLPGWAQDDLREAWPALLATCSALSNRSVWAGVCAAMAQVDGMDAVAVRQFIEASFVPHQVRNLDGSVNGMITGYYEPLLRGSRKRGGRYQTPLHAVPKDLITLDLASVYPDVKNLRLRGRLVGQRVLPYYSRAELDQQNLLAGKELCWVEDPVEAFFLQVQGSGRVSLEEGGETVRLAYADQNGHPYRSIGRYLVDQGELSLEQASMQGIKAWVAANPMRRQELLNANPSYVFFKEEKIFDPSQGPKGSLGVPLTPSRSLAVDPQFIPLGVPVFLATTHPNSQVALRRLMLAQDTGGAIRNPVRADFFWGHGPEAGEVAGKMKQTGQLWVLLPISPAIAPK